MLTKDEALLALAEVEGYDNEGDLLEGLHREDLCGHRPGIPAICLSCGYIEDMEPDCTEGCCPECEQTQMTSAYMLLEVI